MVHTHSTYRVALTLAGVWHEDDILPPLPQALDELHEAVGVQG